MAQQTNPETRQDQTDSSQCADSLVRSVAARLLHFQLQRGRSRTVREVLLVAAGVVVVVAVVALVWFNWSAITSLFDTLTTPSAPRAIR